MAIKPVLIYRNSDSTADLNSRSARIVDRGIFDGGQLTPSGASLSVSIAPFIAAGYDGIVAISDSTEALSIPAPSAPGTLVSYIILHLEYRNLTSTIANLLVIPESTWATSVSRNYFVTFARISVPFGATSILSSYVDYSVGDWADKLGKTGWRAPVADLASLPSTGNRDGDVRLTLDTLVPYVWDASALTWGVLGGTLDLSEVYSRNTELAKQLSRATQGTGLISGIDDQPTATHVVGSQVIANGTGVPYYTIANPNLLGMQGAHWMVHGHFLKTRAQQITLAAPPVGVNPRYDLVFLEVWRETITGTPASQTYTSTSGATWTFDDLRLFLEGFIEAGATPNFDFSSIDYINGSDIVVTKYAYRTFENVNPAAVSDLSVVSGSFTSLDGDLFFIGTGPNDKRVLRATTVNPNKPDNVVYALPLLVVKRPGTTSADPEGPGNYIQAYRPNTANRRFVFDVAPRTETMSNVIVGEALRIPEYEEAEYSQLADGFLTGTDAPLTGAVNTVVVPESVLSIQGYLTHLAAANVTLAAPPATDNRRDLVVLEINKTSYRNNPNADASRAGVSQLFGERVDYQGYDSFAWSARYIVFPSSLSVGASDWVDEDTSMDAAHAGSVVHPLIGSPVWGGYTKVSPGLWRRAALSDEETSASFTDNFVYAIPICLVHRRNTGAYSNTNQNGADVTTPNKLGLPNTLATIPQTREILDLRRKTVIDEATLDAILDESWEKLLRGELATKFVSHPYQSSVVGTAHTIIDQLATSGLALPNAHRVTNGPDGQRTVWSESAEAMLMAWSFTATDVVHNDASVSYAGTPCFAWDGAGSGGTLTVRAPVGCHFSFPNGNAIAPNNMHVVYRDIVGNRVYLGTFTITSITLDGQGNYAEFTAEITHPAMAVAANVNINLSLWAVKANRMAIGYATNDGLYGTPKVIHRIDNGPANERLNVGALKVLIRNVPIDGSFRATITQSMVRTAYASLGYGSLATADSDVRIFGVESIALSNQTATAQVRYIELDDGAGLPALDRCRILFRNTTTATSCDVVVLCDGDQVYRWMECSQPSKQVRGPYQWGFTTFNSANALPYGSTVVHRNALAAQKAYSVPFADACTDVLMGVNGGQSFSAVPFNASAEAIVYISNAGGPYRIWADGADNPRAGITYNFNAVGTSQQYISGWGSATTLSHSDAAGSVSVLVVQPVRIPLSAADQLVLYYEMAPYQGVGNNATALAARGLGVVESVSDMAVTTIGYGTSMWSPRAVTTSNITRSNFNAATRVPHQISADVGPPGAHGADYLGNRTVSRTDYIRRDNLNRFPSSSAPVYSMAVQHLPFPGSFFQTALNCMVGTLITPETLDTTESFTGLDFVPELTGYWPAASPTPRRESTAALQRMLVNLRKIRKGWRVWEVEMHSSGGNATIQGYRWTYTNSSLTPLSSAVNFPAGAGFTSVFDMINAEGTADSLLMLGATAGVAGVWVAGVRVTYRPDELQYTGSTFIRISPESVGSVLSSPLVPLKRGARLADVWGADRAALQSSLVANGAIDWPTNAPVRGVWVKQTPTSFNPVPGQVGYVINVSPSVSGTATSLRAKTWPAPYGSAVTVPTAAGPTPDMAAGEASAFVAPSGATAQSYLIRSENASYRDEVSMGVSTGYAVMSSQYLSLLPGYAFDVFTPVGRPVFKRK